MSIDTADAAFITVNVHMPVGIDIVTCLERADLPSLPLLSCGQNV